ncbi:hypothetical protein CASFOL_028867 [Castilleja foliolosa]|uniref:DNA-directed RNA polymerase n=1 Tax=Castilleja foliolosa TaxID=1961234 RepID=A0ABD3CDX9_9LAMI
MEGEEGVQNPQLALANMLFSLTINDVDDIEKVRLRDEVFKFIFTNDMVLEEMEDSALTSPKAKIISIKFGLTTHEEICKSSVSNCPISHASQLSNPFLGLPLETGKCESCGTGEAGQCEGHFGYIELPTPTYHPYHVGELKRMLSLLCLKCLRFKNRKFFDLI